MFSPIEMFTKPKTIPITIYQKFFLFNFFGNCHYQKICMIRLKSHPKFPHVSCVQPIYLFMRRKLMFDDCLKQVNVSLAQK